MQTGQPNDVSLVPMWKLCRIIGLLNCILLSCELLIIVVSIIYMAFFTKDFKELEFTSSNEFILYIFFLIVVFVLSSMLLYANYGLLKRKTPSDGRVLKKWLLYHTVIFTIFFVISIIGMFFNQHYHSSNIFLSITPAIILMIETIIVGCFEKQLTSPGTENQPSSA